MWEPRLILGRGGGDRRPRRRGRPRPLDVTALGAPRRALPDCHRLAAHLTTELPAVFGLLFDLTLDATNWRAKQALRPAVVNRKVSGGNRSTQGAQRQEILSSVVPTARLRDLDPRDLLVGLLRSPQPTSSPALAALP